MKSRLLFLLAVLIPATRALPCYHITITNIGIGRIQATTSVESDAFETWGTVTCYNYFMNPATSHFEGRTWLVDTQTSSELGVGDSFAGEAQSWSGSTLEIGTKNHCYQGRTRGTSACCFPPQDVEQELGTSELCDTPLIMDLSGDGVKTTALARDPVVFDYDGRGIPKVSAWTARGSESGFLYFDHNRNRQIDGGPELLGNATVLPDGTRADHGFAALAAYDRAANGGNDDGMITPQDGVWGTLRLWVDRNHDALMTADEDYSLAARGVVAIELAYRRPTGSGMDEQGNRHFLIGSYRLRIRNELVVRAVHDVILDARH